MDFLEELLEGRHRNRRGHRAHNHHEDDQEMDYTARRGSQAGHLDHDDDWPGHGRDGHFPMFPWREYLKRPIVRIGLVIGFALLILACLGILLFAWPWLVKAVAYVNQHGLQGVIEAWQNAGYRLWKGNS